MSIKLINNNQTIIESDWIITPVCRSCDLNLHIVNLKLKNRDTKFYCPYCGVQHTLDNIKKVMHITTKTKVKSFLFFHRTNITENIVYRDEESKLWHTHKVV